MRNSNPNNKYEELEQNPTLFNVGFWVRSGVESRLYIRWCGQYTKHIRRGPESFWKWYREQRELSASGAIEWDVVFPHEVFPILTTPEFDDFYPELKMP